MICEVCSKHKATVHLTEIINEQVTKLHICEGCAKKKGTQMEQHFGIADLLQGLADHGEKAQPAVTQKLKCQDCQMTYDQFKKVGRMGCARCYETFLSQLLPLLKRIHSSSHHTGKSPHPPHQDAPGKKASATKAPAGRVTAGDLEELKTQLREAVESEAYEVAAKLRDKIKRIEQAKGKQS